MPQCIPGASNQRYLEGAEEVRDGLAWFGLNLVWFIVTMLLLSAAVVSLWVIRFPSA